MAIDRIPLNDLKRGALLQRDELIAATERVVASGWFVLGPENQAFESELAGYLGSGEVITVANGTEALMLAMLGLDLGPGSRVLTAANAGGYTSTAARAIGAVPVYADIDPISHLLTPTTIEAAVSQLGRVDVVVVTHLFGAAADMPAIMAWADATGTPVIEDCAQSLGATIAGRRAGTFGDLATTSFYPTKNLGALGDGGAVLTSSERLADRVRSLRQYGWRGKYRVAIPGGINSRMDEVQAAILRLKLPHLDVWNERRRAIHAAYESAAPHVRFVNTSSESFVGHLAVIEVDDRDTVVADLASAGIGTDIHYPIPDHRQPVFSDGDLALPATERAAGRVLSVPLFPELTDDEVSRVGAALAEHVRTSHDE